MALPESRYRGDSEIKRFYERALQNIRALPAITDAAAVSGRPMVDRTVDLTTNDFEIEDNRRKTRAERQMQTTGSSRQTTSGPWEFLASRRDITDMDGPDSPRVAVVNQAMARLFWPNDDAVGKTDPAGRRFGTAELGSGHSGYGDDNCGVASDASKFA